MAHNLILQLSRNPIPEDELLVEDDYYDNGFIGGDVDYVTDSDAETDVRRLSSGLKDIVRFDFENRTISFIFRDKFFRPRYDKFVEEMKKLLDDLSYEKFVSSDLDDFELGLYRLNLLSDDRRGFRVHFEGTPMSFSEFLRFAKDGEVFYYGNTLDYHS